MKITARLLAVAGVLALVPLGLAASTPLPCTSQGCADCENDANGIASCTTVARSSYCDCLLRVQNPYTCILSGACTYQPGGGGGGGGGASGGGGSACMRLPGGWCPSECSSCETIFWN